jgi:hypothetical protein
LSRPALPRPTHPNSNSPSKQSTIKIRV